MMNVNKKCEKAGFQKTICSDLRYHYLLFHIKIFYHSWLRFLTCTNLRILIKRVVLEIKHTRLPSFLINSDH